MALIPKMLSSWVQLNRGVILGSSFKQQREIRIFWTSLFKATHRKNIITRADCWKFGYHGFNNTDISNKIGKNTFYLIHQLSGLHIYSFMISHEEDTSFETWLDRYNVSVCAVRSPLTRSCIYIRSYNRRVFRTLRTVCLAVTTYVDL